MMADTGRPAKLGPAGSVRAPERVSGLLVLKRAPVYDPGAARSIISR
jgi:hypothetical protein